MPRWGRAQIARSRFDREPAEREEAPTANTDDNFSSFSSHFFAEHYGSQGTMFSKVVRGQQLNSKSVPKQI